MSNNITKFAEILQKCLIDFPNFDQFCPILWTLADVDQKLLAISHHQKKTEKKKESEKGKRCQTNCCWYDCQSYETVEF